MMQRCVWNSADKMKKKYYKSKNIDVYEGWHLFSGFKETMYSSFIEHCKEYGVFETTIDRIDNSIGYNPENCRWATKEEQSNNRECVPKVTVDIDGQTITCSISELARRIGMNYQTIRSRYLDGWRGDKLIQDLIKESGANYKKPVRRINDGVVFDSARIAADECGLLSYHNILSCCRGQFHYSGIHPVTGEKCRWEFADRP